MKIIRLSGQRVPRSVRIIVILLRYINIILRVHYFKDVNSPYAPVTIKLT